jgi:hypothetical protein
MAFFDQGNHFDSDAHFDEGAGPGPQPKPKTIHTMAKPRLELQKKTDDALKGFCENHVTKMTGNTNFPTPIPDVADYGAVLTAYSTKLAAYRALEDEIAQARIEKDAARLALEQATTGRGGYVETASGGDAAKILSAGFEVRGAAAPVGVPGAPIGLLAQMGEMSGQIVLSWSKVHGANSYVVECRQHDNAASAWALAKIVTAARLKLDGLTPGTVYAFRVKAVGAAGEGPWSDETVKMAP